MCSVLKVVFALTINTDIDFSYIFFQRTNISLILCPCNLNICAKQIWAYPKTFSSRSSRPFFFFKSLLCSYSKLGLHLTHHSAAIWLCNVVLYGRCSNLSSGSVPASRGKPFDNHGNDNFYSTVCYKSAPISQRTQLQRLVF